MILHSRRSRIVGLAMAAVVLVGILAVVFFHWATVPRNPAPTPTGPETDPDAFTFFSIGPDTTLTDGLTAYLETRLGSGAMESRTTIDLTLPGIYAFADHFPRLHALHQTFNHGSGRRVEHDTTRLTYRYARKNKGLFDIVRLVFSREDKKPLYFHLYVKRDGDAFIRTLREKYGPPRQIAPPDSQGPVYFWKRPSEVLVVSVTPNRSGYDEYHFGIYYLENLDLLADRERLEKERMKRERDAGARRVF